MPKAKPVTLVWVPEDEYHGPEPKPLEVIGEPPGGGDDYDAPGQHTIEGQYNFTPDGAFTKPYDTDVWIAGEVRENPTENSQGFYAQHRVVGDLGGLVHDAGAAELRLNDVSNTGTGQSAFEASLVVTGGENDANLFCGVLANFHTSGAPTGTVDYVDLMRSTQIPPLPGGFTIGRVIGLHVDQQIVGTENFSIYAADGRSVFGPIVPKDVNSGAGVFRGLSGQVTAILSVQNSTPTSLFNVFANGTAGLGGQITGSTFYINNNLATAGTFGLVMKAISGQTAAMMEVRDSTDAAKLQISAAGNGVLAIGTGAAFIIRNVGNSGSFMTLDSTGLRWNDAGLQQTTVGAAGGASALPATPTKYMKIKDSAGTVLVIPAYNAT